MGFFYPIEKGKLPIDYKQSFSGFLFVCLFAFVLPGSNGKDAQKGLKFGGLFRHL